MASQPDWVNWPLPQGWEAKYDAAQKRYFFIDHVGKGTTWEDPRKTVWEHQQQNQQPKQLLGNPWQQVGGSGHGQRASPQASPRTSPRPSPRPSPGHSPARPQSGEGRRDSGNWQQMLEDKYGLKVKHIHDDDSEEETGFKKVAIRTPSGTPASESPHLPQMRQEFPSADPELIKDLLRQADNDEFHVRRQLDSLGFAHNTSGTSHAPSGAGTSHAPSGAGTSHAPSGAKGSHAHSSAGGSHAHSSAGGSHAHSSAGGSHAHSSAGGSHAHSSVGGSHAHSSAGGSHAHSSAGGTSRAHHSSSRSSTPQRAPSPAARAESPREVSVQEKERMKTNLKKEFPECSQMKLEMALDACKYDEKKTRMLLQTMGTMGTRPKESSSNASTSHRTSTSTATASASTVTTTSHKSNERSLEIPTATETAGHSTYSAVTFPTPSFTVPSSGPAMSHLSGAFSSSSISPAKPTAKPTAKPRKSKYSAPPTRVVASGEYQSANRGGVKGPDPTLAKGPCLDNIIDNYTIAHGPNKGNRVGPSSANHRGASGARGPDRSLHCGPSPLNRYGADDSYAHGAMFTSAAHQVTAVTVL